MPDEATGSRRPRPAVRAARRVRRGSGHGIDLRRGGERRGLEGLPGPGLAVDVELTTAGRLVAKRSLDAALALALLVAACPVLVVAAVAVLVESGRPVLFRQDRVGLHGTRFRVAKLRTMVQGAEALEALLRCRSLDPDWLLLDRDPRVTRVGRLLRRLSLDELPQLWQVLRGEMSLVGPRPLSLTDQAAVPAWARLRLQVRPGLTGPWQVSGRTQLPFAQMIEMDVAYVRQWSLRGDLGLLVRTLPAVLRCTGSN